MRERGLLPCGLVTWDQQEVRVDELGGEGGLGRGPLAERLHQVRRVVADQGVHRAVAVSPMSYTHAVSSHWLPQRTVRRLDHPEPVQPLRAGLLLLRVVRLFHIALVAVESGDAPVRVDLHHTGLRKPVENLPAARRRRRPAVPATSWSASGNLAHPITVTSCEDHLMVSQVPGPLRALERCGGDFQGPEST